jgi:prepilin-type N-terminal cleavage/methylation domain-containing protein
MKPLGNFKGQPGGFTLLEVIIALIVGSILGAILLEFLGQTVHKSFEPIKMAQGSTDLTAIVEKMNTDYKKQMLLSLRSPILVSDPLNDFKDAIENNTRKYGDYTVSATWIEFNPSGEPNQFIETADNNPLNHKILKVTVVHGQQEITTLFTR